MHCYTNLFAFGADQSGFKLTVEKVDNDRIIPLSMCLPKFLSGNLKNVTHMEERNTSLPTELERFTNVMACTFRSKLACKCSTYDSGKSKKHF